MEAGVYVWQSGEGQEEIIVSSFEECAAAGGWGVRMDEDAGV